jgi:hypothetical protein
MVSKYIMCFRPFVLYGDVGVIRVCAAAANGRTWVFLGEMRSFEFFTPWYIC